MQNFHDGGMNSGPSHSKEKKQSVYAARPGEEWIESHTLAMIVANEPGVLARVIGLFSGRGYNIESLNVAETDHAQGMSRITIVSSGTPEVIQQIIAQLDRLVPVQSVRDLTTFGDYVQRELVLAKVAGDTAALEKAKGVAAAFDAKVAKEDEGYCLLECSGPSERVEEFMQALAPFDVRCASRTGVAALSCRKDTLHI